MFPHSIICRLSFQQILGCEINLTFTSIKYMYMLLYNNVIEKYLSFEAA